MILSIFSASFVASYKLGEFSGSIWSCCYLVKHDVIITFCPAPVSTNLATVRSVFTQIDMEIQTQYVVGRKRDTFRMAAGHTQSWRHMAALIETLDVRSRSFLKCTVDALFIKRNGGPGISETAATTFVVIDFGSLSWQTSLGRSSKFSEGPACLYSVCSVWQGLGCSYRERLSRRH